MTVRWSALLAVFVLVACDSTGGADGSGGSDGADDSSAADGADDGNASGHDDGGVLVDGAVGEAVTRRLSVAHNTTCFVREGTLYCWGSVDFGQFGNGTRNEDPHPTPAVMPTADVRSVALSRWASYAVTEDDELWVSGLDNHGQLPSETQTAVKVSGLPAVSAAAGTYRVGCYVTKSDGSLHCMGENEYGEVGDGSGDDQDDFADVSLSDVTSLSGGYEFVCAVSAGDVYCWGNNNKGQIGNGAGGDGIEQATPAAVSIPGDAIEVAAGHQHACALTSTGDVYCWGINWGHQAASTSDGTQCGAHECVRSPKKVAISDAVDIAAADAASCAAKGDGTVSCWGDAPLTAGASSLADVVEVASGHESNHFCALLESGSDESVKCWGTSDTYGQLGRGSVEANAASQKIPALVALPD